MSEIRYHFLCTSGYKYRLVRAQNFHKALWVFRDFMNRTRYYIWTPSDPSLSLSSNSLTFHSHFTRSSHSFLIQSLIPLSYFTLLPNSSVLFPHTSSRFHTPLIHPLPLSQHTLSPLSLLSLKLSTLSFYSTHFYHHTLSPHPLTPLFPTHPILSHCPTHNLTSQLHSLSSPLSSHSLTSPSIILTQPTLFYYTLSFHSLHLTLLPVSHFIPSYFSQFHTLLSHPTFHSLNTLSHPISHPFP